MPRPIGMLASPIGAVMLQLIKRPGPVTAMIRGSGHAASLEDGRIPARFIEWRTAVSRYTDWMRNERAMLRAIIGRDGWRQGLTFTDGELAEIAQSTLMLFGTADATGSPAVWKRVMDLIPRGRLRLIDGAGHVPWLDEPATVAAEVRRFLAVDDDPPGG